jgi:hypothetical protein
MKRQELKIDKSAMAHAAEDAEVSWRYPPRYPTLGVLQKESVSY